MFRRRRRVPAATSVSIDGDALVVAFGDDARRLTVDDLTSVVIRTTDRGPFVDDVFWHLGLVDDDPDAEVVVPSETPGCSDVITWCFEHLAGLDGELLVEAVLSVENRTFVCWTRPAPTA